jgi:MoaA/NifB/PqqE/SkfB family radical SAM enzyme
MFEKKTDNSSRDWAADFRARAARDRIPVTAMLELTSRCNFRCQHCYLGDQTQHHASGGKERSTDQVKDSLREWADAGCLYLTITGGDPMMRKDFSEIYRTACELGMLVTVFSNGTLAGDSIIELFREYPPRLLEVSIYGATAPVYESVTKVRSSFEKAWKGILRLHAAGFPLTLKTVVLTLNEHELEMMVAQAEDLGCKFRYDSTVFPCLADGLQEPLSLRVSPEVAVNHDTRTPERRKAWAENITKKKDRPTDEYLYQCGAGRTAFYADPYGTLSPCLMATKYSYSTEGRSFMDVWRGDLKEIRERKRTGGDNILSGKLQGACTHCPAMNFVETGDEEQESDYIRQTAELRYETVMKDENEVI